MGLARTRLEVRFQGRNLASALNRGALAVRRRPVHEAKMCGKDLLTAQLETGITCAEFR